MKPIARYILPMLIAAGLLSCTDDITVPKESAVPGDGSVSITLSFPEMGNASTRTFGGSAPDLTNLDLYLFVFDGNDLKQTLHIDPQQTDWDSEPTNRLKFKAMLPQTDDKATVHIVAIDDKDGKFARQIDDVGYGIEDAVMPALYTSGETSAYWQRVELGCPIIVSVDNTTDDTLDDVKGTEDQVAGAFANPIPLVRNFAKVSLTCSATAFSVLGWTIVNDLNGGSVVPWYSPKGGSDIEYAKYADFSKSPVEVYNYEKVTEQGYRGVSLASADLRNMVDDMSETEGTDWNTNDKYAYERSISSVDPLYVLLYGKYDGSDRPGYYKLALGHRDETTGLFTQYNVLRNIKYTIRITGVQDGGYATPQEAAAAPPFNNVSGDVTTSDLTQISDGRDMIYVSAISIIITEPDQVIDFRYRYLEDITNSRSEKNDIVVYDAPGIGIEQGDVIKKYLQAVDVSDAKTGLSWKSVSITPDNPTDDLKEQSFTIYSPPSTDPNGTFGLARTVHMILRNPWNYVRLETFPGLINDDQAWPEYDPDEAPSDPDVNYYIGGQKGAPLTLFWELPAGLPEAIFPLQFTIESDRQNIENASIGKCVVQTGPSLFPGVTDTRISFVKTVTWRDYVPNGVSTPASRIIRARFVTTTNMATLTDDSKVTTLKIHNPYFNDAEDMFERDINVTVDGNSPLIWDISGDEWTSLHSTISGGASRYWYDHVNGLTVSTGWETTANDRTLISGGDADNGYYIQMARSAQWMSFSFTYGADSVPREGILKITAMNNVGLNVTQTGATSVSAVNGNTFTPTKSEKEWKVTVPANATTVTIKFQPASNSAIRIYKVEYDPYNTGN